MHIKRRNFLQLGSLATGSMMVPNFLKAFEKSVAVPAGNKVVVIIQFSGGNDGLNTVIPVRNDIYYRQRPKLGIKKESVLTINDEAGFHPSLTFFRELLEAGSLGILNGVGYPNPDRSHFRSMDIWQSASDSREYIDTGWLGRYLDAQCKPGERPTKAMEIDDVLSLVMKGEQMKGLAFRDPRKLYGSSQENYFKELSAAHKYGGEEAPVDYLYKTMAETLSSADYIFQQSKLHPSRQAYPASALGHNLKTIASLIFSEINTSVYYVSLGSFDTHFAQEAQQKRLFTELNEAVKSFTDDLKANGRFDDVLLFTFSEFGRRVAQNASGGTDHGTANNMFFISGSLKQKGLINALPDLSDLQDGDLKHTVDFRDVYATVLHKWLDADAFRIIGKKSNYLGFI
jgi:uncharacterized protein (DUF1501 family)